MAYSSLLSAFVLSQAIGRASSL